MNGVYDAMIENLVTCGCLVDRVPRGCIWCLECLSAGIVTGLLGFGVLVLLIGYWLVNKEMNNPAYITGMAVKELWIGKVQGEGGARGGGGGGGGGGAE